jgi:ribonuclease HI
MYFDGSLKLQGAGTGILFTAPRGEHLRYALQLLFPASNNAAEYEVLIHGLNIAISLGIKRLMVYGDSVTPGFKGQSRVHLIHAPRRQHI